MDERANSSGRPAAGGTEPASESGFFIVAPTEDVRQVVGPRLRFAYGRAILDSRARDAGPIGRCRVSGTLG